MESEESTFLGTDYLEQFKEKYNVTALAKAEKVIFNNIAMKQLNFGDIQSLLKGDLLVKHKNTAELPNKGTASGNLHEVWSMIRYFEIKLQANQTRIYAADDIPDYYIVCWGKFGNEEVFDFNEYFEIFPQYKGWAAGVQYGI